MTAKSESPASDDSMLRIARRSSVRCAFIITNHRCVPEMSNAFFFVVVFFILKYLNTKILYVKLYVRLTCVICLSPRDTRS